MVQLVDLTATLLTDAGSDLPGAPLRIRPGHGDPGELLAQDRAAQVVGDGFIVFFVVFIAGPLLAFGAVGASLRAGRMHRPDAARGAAGVGLCAGAVPVASFLADATPWAQWAHPALAFWAMTGLGALVLAGAARSGPWGRHPYRPAALIAALTVGVLTIDVVTGSGLQWGTPFGLSPLIAGRFHGFGNIAFAVFAMSTLVLLAAVATMPVRRCVAAVVVAALGAGAVLIDGWPGLGTDVGGVPALAVGVGMLALGVAGIRVGPGAAVGLTVFGAGLIAALGLLDRTRPPDTRTHLGRFAQDVLDGRGWSVIRAKAEANLSLFTDHPVIILAAVALLSLVVTALMRPERLGLYGLARVQLVDPVFRALLPAALAVALIGFATNDSGVIVPAVALFAGGPLFLAIWAPLWAGGSLRASPTAGPPPDH